MIVRDANSRDFASIEAMHGAMDVGYILPDLKSPLFFVRKVAENGTGVMGACFLRLNAECFLWLHPALGPNVKLDVMEALQPQTFADAWRQGIDQIEARIPETIERRFQKRLKQLGWKRGSPDWHTWGRNIDGA